MRPLLDQHLDGAFEALGVCDDAVLRLHKMCCEPNRSPQMVEIEESLATIRAQLELIRERKIGIDTLGSALEDTGARIGRLQVGCCAPARMPLYAEALRGLTDIQLALSRASGTAH